MAIPDPDVATPGAAPAPRRQGAPVGRRIVLGMLGLGAAGVATGRWLSDGVSTVVASTAPALASVIPAAGGFRIYSVTLRHPEVAAQDYRLAVTGMVDRELSLGLADLAALPQTGLTKDFQCVTGWRVNDVPWSGVLLRDVLDQAGVEAGAAALRFASFDGVYTESLTLEQAMRPDVLVATSMFGAPIQVKHGAPVRLYVAPMYGYKSLKWLGGIEVARTVTPGYWEQRGYDVDAYIGASNGRSDDPDV
ncbi:MAG: molybdopterin-dependent oxidoreductase [Candidatus Nanopelagicales bacterium]